MVRQIRNHMSLFDMPQGEPFLLDQLIDIICRESYPAHQSARVTA